ncbi:MAG TPA: hypothetical protein ENJ60_05495 [Aeromonadales bacterium]|nr:hypothetical protein [Aeromonadales bacterium]
MIQKKTGLIGLSLLILIANVEIAASDLKVSSVEEAVVIAQKAPPEGTKGVFRIKVRGAYRTPKVIFLNSSKKFREQDNVTVVVTRAAILQFREKYGKDIDEYFYHKKITVAGKIKVEKVFEHGHDGQYFFNNRIWVTSIDQIKNL